MVASMTGHPVRPIQPAKDSVYCPHCKRILRDAVQTEEGDRLCETCCAEIKKMPASTCSDCGISIRDATQVYPDRAARREISGLLVHCPYEGADCPWTGPLREVESHSKKCSFKQVKCPHTGCETWTTASKLDAHMKECVYREVSCKYCSTTLPYSQLPSHYQNDCQDYPQPCHQCGKAVSRHNLQKHLQDECDMEKCFICKSLVKRDTTIEVGNSSPHLSNPVTTFRHTQMISTNLQQVSTDLFMLQSPIHELQEGKGASKELMTRLESFESMIRTWQLDGELQKTVKLQQMVLQEQGQQVAELSRQLQTIRTDLEQNKQAIKRFQGYDYSTPNGPHRFDTTTDSRVTRMERSIEELERTTSLMKVHISELELQLQASMASTHNGSFLWRIPEIARRKRDALEGRITSIYSPPFYSGRNGYKMCIRAYLNGDGIGYKTHLSVFFVLMKGEYDPLLKWPFDCKVSLILVDQNLRKHIVQTFKPTPESSSFQQPRLDMNVASGCPQFAKLSVLEDENYVKDDVIFLKCIIDTSKIFHP